MPGRKERIINYFNHYLDERYNMPVARDFIDKQMHKRLPPHTGWPHVFGSLSLILFLSQIITGILLLIYYRPTPEEAHKSIQYITADVHFGWLYRQVHAWGATLMILAVILHMARTFFMGTYKKPRELTWVIGVIIFIVTIVFGFTGYLLPWNQLSYWATTVGTEISGAIPIVGPWMKTFILGSENVSGETLSRFFTVHVIILPWILFFLVAIHLVLMRSQNLATMEPVGEERPTPPECGIPFWPVHLAKEGCVTLIVLGILVTLSVLSPWEIGEPADPLQTPEAIKPEWYFLPTYQLLKYFTGPMGKILGIGVSMVPFVLLLVWPYLDRSKPRHPKQRPISTTIGVAALILALFFGVLGHFSESHLTLLGQTYEIDVYGVPHRIDRETAVQVGEETDHPEKGMHDQEHRTKNTF
ncbi:MAG: cytochrome bc complex cytochrome b subunit [Planctomycetota bacterium]|nr:MAG: cytochrome bc complex cytochrome b subunit [Planctomycetota bacterium]